MILEFLTRIKEIWSATYGLCNLRDCRVAGAVGSVPAAAWLAAVCLRHPGALRDI